MEPTSPYRIAIVDDEKELLQNYESLLEDVYSVSTFDDPLSFLRSLEDPGRPKPDLLITDLKMPAIDGIQMVSEARRKGVYFPFVLMTGHLDKSAAVSALDLGAFRLLEKPVRINQLVGVIDQLLLEHQIVEVRKEIRTLMSQLREIYSGLRIAILPHFPEDLLNRTVVESTRDGKLKKLSFEEVLETLESRLDFLLKSEKLLNEMKPQANRD